MKSYIAHVSSRRLYRALNISKACYHSNSNSVSWEIYSWAAIEAHQAIFHSKQNLLMCQVLKHCGFSGVSPDGNCSYVHWGSFTSKSTRYDWATFTARGSPNLGQSDEPSDILWAPRHDIATWYTWYTADIFFNLWPGPVFSYTW